MTDRELKEFLEVFGSALNRLDEVLQIPVENTDIALDASIQRFEFSFELAWKAVKHFALKEGLEVKSPREAVQKAFRLHWIDDETVWLRMLDDRNMTSHTYRIDLAKDIYSRLPVYHDVMQDLYANLKLLT